MSSLNNLLYSQLLNLGPLLYRHPRNEPESRLFMRRVEHIAFESRTEESRTKWDYHQPCQPLNGQDLLFQQLFFSPSPCADLNRRILVSTIRHCFTARKWVSVGQHPINVFALQHWSGGVSCIKS
jgi:hypothetical protein